MPTMALQICNSQGGNSNRTDAPFRTNTCMCSNTLDVDGHTITASGPNRHFDWRASIPIKRQFRVSKQARGCMSRTLQPNLFLYKPGKRQGRMRQTSSQDFQSRRKYHTAACTVISTQSGMTIDRNHFHPSTLRANNLHKLEQYPNEHLTSAEAL